MTKIVFLDFDGVLLPDPDARAQAEKGLTQSNYLATVVFNPLCVANLLSLVKSQHCEIVLSTSWAAGNSMSQLSNCLMRNGIDPTLIFEYDDPGEKNYMTPRDSTIRGEQIQSWLREHPEITQWVAIDDDSTVLLLKQNFVRTNPSLGFDKVALQKSLAILQ